MNHDCIRARAAKYLDGDGDGSDNIWNEGSDFLHRFALEREVIVVDSELSHQEERSAEEVLALWMQDTYVSFEFSSSVDLANESNDSYGCP